MEQRQPPAQTHAGAAAFPPLPAPGAGIVAGYDGSPGSVQALNWAIRAALRRHVRLTVCHAWAPVWPTSPDAAAALERSRRTGERVLAAGMRYVRALAGPDVDVRPLLTGGPAALALAERGSDAGILVVGARGGGTMAGLLVGSVSMQVAAHSQGNVVVVRGHWWPPGGYVPGVILVGADGSTGSDAAVKFAFAEAELHGAKVLAIWARAGPSWGLRRAAEAERDFEQQITQAEKEHLGVDVIRQVVGRPPADALLAAAIQAQLLVVGAHGGDGGKRGMRLGRVARAVLRHASCPVGVIRPPGCRP